MFKIIPSPAFGLNYDPSHLVWMQMDEIKPIYDFRDKLFHIKTFLFNAGLDVGYMAFGLFLVERGARVSDGAMLQGFGYSLILQGGVLLGFDLAMFFIESRRRRSLDALVPGLPAPGESPG